MEWFKTLPVWEQWMGLVAACLAALVLGTVIGTTLRLLMGFSKEKKKK
ncbi:MAG: hypothetical protein IJC85_07205 [Oscillospiraceae bacterium]|nr:hypothetical protein [Oscillospiraceae bacterium]